MEASTKNFFEDILFNSKNCTLATASKDGKPEAATIDYYADSDYNIYFNSFPQYRKYQNIKTNPVGSIVITHDLNTIQIDGSIIELANEEKEWAKKNLLEKNPGDEIFLNNPEGLFFKFKPNWIRFLMNDGESMPTEVLVKP